MKKSKHSELIWSNFKALKAKIIPASGIIAAGRSIGAKVGMIISGGCCVAAEGANEGED